MPNLMARAAAWHGENLKASAGRSVEYNQRGETAIDLTATLVTETYEVRKGDGTFDSVVSQDWTITAADLGGLTPVNGDLITETVDGVTTTYEVMPIGKLKCFEPLDKVSGGVLLTVHSKRIDVDA